MHLLSLTFVCVCSEVLERLELAAMKHRILFAVAVPGVLLGSFVLSPMRTISPIGAVHAVSVLSGPSTWTAFSADVRITSAKSSSVLAGRFFRSSNGSTRLETGPQDTPEVRVISIQNIELSTLFIYSPAPSQGWVARPMKLPAEGWHPQPISSNMAGLSRTTETWEGRDVYRYERKDHIALLAPDLNFFAVVRDTKDRDREEYHNIQLGEQPLELFSPPVGATVVKSSRPGGIVVGAHPGEPIQ